MFLTGTTLTAVASLTGCTGPAFESSSGTATKTDTQCSSNYVDFWQWRPPPIGWTQDTVLVTYGQRPGKDVYLAVQEGDTVLGGAYLTSPMEGSLVADGHPIQLNQRLSGKHTIRAKMYLYSGEENQFDPDQGTLCRHDGKIVQSQKITVNFSKLDRNTMTSASDQAI